MNMKKTLAGVMAGAMAVSAMATIVSADQDQIALTYDLKRYEQDLKDGTCVVTSKYVPATDATAYIITDDNGVDAVTGAPAYMVFEADQAYLKGKEAIAAEVTIAASMKTDTGASAQAIPPQTFKLTKDAELAAKDPNMFLIKSMFNGGQVKVPLTVSPTETNKLHIENFELGTKLNYGAAYAGKYGVNSAEAKVTYKIPAQIPTRLVNRWSDTFTDAQYEILGMDVKGMKTPDLSDLNGGLTCKDIAFETLAGARIMPSTYAVTSMVAGTVGEKVFPFKTVLNPAYSTKYDPATGKVLTVGANDVVAALKARKSEGNYYTSPVAVINDAIANNEEVTFTFKTFGDYVTTNKSVAAQQWLEADRAYGYKTTNWDWYNPAFSQHLYTNEYNTYSPFGSDAYDMYGSYSSAWGTNLFTGAVVVNSGLTMQLNQTDKFFWGNDTLSFDWFAITDEGKITNAKQFLTSMLLYTPVDWYWDTLTVTVGSTEEDEVAANESLEADGDVIDDEEIDEIVDEIIDEVIDEALEEAVVEETPVEPAPSPATGNAPVALAVIPVALAAAAVVAKKRG